MDGAVATKPADWFDGAVELVSTPSSSAIYSRRSLDYVDKFYDALSLWREQTGHLSSIQEIVGSPHLRTIVDMGPIVVPLIAHELQRRPDFLFVAMQRITGQDPVPQSARGNVRKMVEAWLLWAERSL